MTPVKIKQDDDSHWYIVPNELEEEFDTLLRNIYVAYEDEGHDSEMAWQLEAEFIDKFSKYMKGGNVNNYQLYISPEELFRLTKLK